MSESQRTPDASDDAQQRAGATEDYGGVPISEQEMAQVWTTGDGDDPPGDAGGAATEDDTVSSADGGDDGDIKPEVPTDDPKPVEPA